MRAHYCLRAGLVRLLRMPQRHVCYSTGDCQVFPVVYGEWGSALKDTRDITVRLC
jgi:hypothetical protein